MLMLQGDVRELISMRRRPNNAGYDSVTSGAPVLDAHVCRGLQYEVHQL